MRGVISFSLFGTDTKFLKGIVTNLELCRQYYSNCDILIFADKKQSMNLELFQNEFNFQIREMPDSVKLEGMFWRFHSIEDANYDFYIFRDADSRITSREAEMVKEWLRSGKNLHIIRDHPMHNAPILGGMWGIRFDRDQTLQTALGKYSPKGYYGEDQEFIWTYVYRQNRGNMIVHDPYFMREPRSQKSRKFGVSLNYVGESIDEFNNSSLELRNLIIRWEKSTIFRMKLRFASLVMKFKKR